MRELRDVVLTGMGCITARGDLSFGGNTPLREAEAANTDSRPIEGFKLENYLASSKTYLDRCSSLALGGCALALRDAGTALPLAEGAAERFGITLGTHLGCVSTMKAFWDKIETSGARLANPILFSHSYFNSPISLCAIEFGLKGYHTTFCAGERSGLEAVRAASDAIRLGHADAIVCGGVEALTPERTQFEPQNAAGEAAAFFVLENADSAIQRRAARMQPLSDDDFRAADGNMAAAIAAFGHCGGATGALALALTLQSSSTSDRA